MNCIGIDVGKQELVVYDGEKSQVFPNTEELEEFRSYLNKYDKDTMLVFEPTSTYSRYLELLCKKEQILCSMPNPRIVPNMRKVEMERNKTDLTDSQLLYIYGNDKKNGKIIEVDVLVGSLSSLILYHRRVLKDRVAYQGLKEALSRDPLANEGVLGEINAEIVRLKAKEKEIITRAEKLIREEERESLERLRSIPGVGPVTSVVLMWLFLKYRDTNRSQIVSLVGFDAVVKESGTSVKGKAHISNMGNDEVRRVLYEASFAASRFNPDINEFYQKLKKRGKEEKVARIAAARKLLIIAHAVYKKQVMYHSPNADVA